MDIHSIHLEHLPHRYPFLLGTGCSPWKSANRSTPTRTSPSTSPSFRALSHHPVMPGVLIMEALAQAAGILSFKTMGEKPDPNSVFYFVGIDEALQKPRDAR